MDVAELIRREVARRGLSQRQAAAEMGVNQSLLSRWLSDDGSVPRSDNCAKIAEFLGMDTAVLLQMVGHMPAPKHASSLQQAWAAFQHRVLPLFGDDPEAWPTKLDTFEAIQSQIDAKAGANRSKPAHPTWQDIPALQSMSQAS